MPSRMATTAVTTISSVSVKPVCRFMGGNVLRKGWDKPAVRHTCRAIRRTGLWGLPGGRGPHNAPKRGQGATIEPSTVHTAMCLQGLDQSIHGVRGGCAGEGHAMQLPTDAHVTPRSANARRDPAAGRLRAQPDHVTGALRVSGAVKSPRLRCATSSSVHARAVVDVLRRPFCDLGECSSAMAPGRIAPTRPGRSRWRPAGSPVCSHQAREVVASRTMQPGLLERLPLTPDHV